MVFIDHGTGRNIIWNNLSVFIGGGQKKIKWEISAWKSYDIIYHSCIKYMKESMEFKTDFYKSFWMF